MCGICLMVASRGRRLVPGGVFAPLAEGGGGGCPALEAALVAGLKRRGPDCFGTGTVALGGDELTLSLFGSVLHMRGTGRATRQPFAGRGARPQTEPRCEPACQSSTDRHLKDTDEHQSSLDVRHSAREENRPSSSSKEPEHPLRCRPPAETRCAGHAGGCRRQPDAAAAIPAAAAGLPANPSPRIFAASRLAPQQSSARLRGEAPSGEAGGSAPVALLWNGEVFEGLGVSPEQNTLENDTCLVHGELAAALREASAPGLPAGVADAVPGAIRVVLRSVKGPYAFAVRFFDRRKGATRTFFGRDPLGRRSLVAGVEAETDDSGLVCSRLYVSSVGPLRNASTEEEAMPDASAAPSAKPSLHAHAGVVENAGSTGRAARSRRRANTDEDEAPTTDFCCETRGKCGKRPREHGDGYEDCSSAKRALGPEKEAAGTGDQGQKGDAAPVKVARELPDPGRVLAQIKSNGSSAEQREERHQVDRDHQASNKQPAADELSKGRGPTCIEVPTGSFFELFIAGEDREGVVTVTTDAHPWNVGTKAAVTARAEPRTPAHEYFDAWGMLRNADGGFEAACATYRGALQTAVNRRAVLVVRGEDQEFEGCADAPVDTAETECRAQNAEMQQDQCSRGKLQGGEVDGTSSADSNTHESLCKRDVDTTGECRRANTSTEEKMRLTGARVGVLYSGGVDCAVLAAMAHQTVPLGEPIDLLNVAFGDSPGNTPDRLAALSGWKELREACPGRPWNLIEIDITEADVLRAAEHLQSVIAPAGTVMDLNIATALWHASTGVGRLTPDDSASGPCLAPPSLLRCAPNDASPTVAHEHDDDFTFLRHALSQELSASRPWISLSDLSKTHRLPYAAAKCRKAGEYVSLAARKGLVLAEGKGIHLKVSLPGILGEGIVAETPLVRSSARALLVGMGADETLGGYSRYRVAFAKAGNDPSVLVEELQKDFNRLWQRNLGRDDRVISDCGKEARFPFLDEDVLRALSTLNLSSVCDLTKPLAVGDKQILRKIACELGIPGAASLQKRAIQFGTRLANSKIDGAAPLPTCNLREAVSGFLNRSVLHKKK
ncbi:Asparagine synthetase domain-containing protein [Diplonema papillatum]|nr:Asparagine synthetase domain-containing protein [Diplonema papillatum]